MNGFEENIFSMTACFRQTTGSTRMIERKMKEKQVDYRFKILYAVGILVVVSGHCGNGGVSLFYDWFHPYAFHLGLFAFASGYFYQESSEKNIKGYLLKKVKSLILPLYLWNVFYAIFVSILAFKGFTIGAGVTLSKLIVEPVTTGHQFIYNLGGWFVIPLFMIQVFNVVVRKIIKVSSGTKEIMIFACYMCLGICGVYLSSKGYNTGWWLVFMRVFCILPFFGAGVLYRKVLEKHDNLSNIVYFSIVLFIDLLVLMYCRGTPEYSLAFCSGFDNIWVEPYLVGFLGIAFWLRIARILEPVIGRSKGINIIADNAYAIMIHQLLGFMIVKTVFALVSKYTILCQDFDWVSYKTQIWNYYRPAGINQVTILYTVAGIVVPIFIQYLCLSLKKKISGFR